MNELVAMIIGTEMEEKMKEAGTFDHFREAETEQEKLRIVTSTEKMVLDVIDKITKPNEELNAEEIADKSRLTLVCMNAQYEYFEVGQKYEISKNDEEVTALVSEIKMRSGINKEEILEGIREMGLADRMDKVEALERELNETEDEEIFVHDTLNTPKQ